MIVPAAKLPAFLTPDQPVVLRDPGRNLLDSALPYEEAWRMSIQGIVEGKVIGSRLRYLRLLSDSEVELRRKWESNSRSSLTEGDKGRSTVIAHTGLGCYQEPLREVKMSSNIFGMRAVEYEGDFAFKCWSHINKK
jgi:hypothetical protein